jgi:hypothetical protein
VRPEHLPKGDPCRTCGRAAAQHRRRSRARGPYFKAYRAKKTGAKPKPKPKVEVFPTPPKKGKIVLGLDGEGHSTKDGRHLYTYLAASSSDGSFVQDVENRAGLTTGEVFDFLLSLPRGALLVGFSLGYDYTKWLEGLPELELWHLYRQDEPRPGQERLGEHGPRAMRVHLADSQGAGALYSVNMMGTKLTVGGAWDLERKRYRRSAAVWDLFRFYQRSFVASLREWKVGTDEEVAEIERMKAQRGDFAGIDDREKDYCRKECALLAQLAERLISSCREAGLELRDYYGAGSLGAATLRNGPAKAQKAKLPKGMRRAVACAFAGGRFEHSARGPIPRSRGYDLASAYPFAETRIPCLAHGRWEHLTTRGKDGKTHAALVREVRAARLALVRYALPARLDAPSRALWDVAGLEALVNMPDVPDDVRVSDVPWGPFPFRLEDGSILFPVESQGGWVWSPELLAALDHPERWPNVELREAWVLRGRCGCGPPFKAEVEGYYEKRLQWGKEGRGLVLKKGLASRYGKRAQTVGAAPFSCPVAAGLITSMTRAELLHALAEGWDDVLGVATDGIIARKRLELPRLAEKGAPKPLGAWEEKDSGPVFLVRPGMRFSQDLESEEGTTAARGVGVKRLHVEREVLMSKWEDEPASPASIPRGTVFHGAKLSVLRVWKRPPVEKIPKVREIDERVMQSLDPEEIPAFVKVMRRLRGSADRRLEQFRQLCHDDPSMVIEAVIEESEGKLARELGGNWEYRRLPEFGRWTQAKPFNVSYSPLPKRPCATKGHRFLTWALTEACGESAPYDPIVSRMRADVQELREADDEAAAQPDGEMPGPGGAQ